MFHNNNIEMKEKKTIPVIGMMCAGCAANVEKKINSLDGVVEASVSLPGRTVLVEYDSDVTSPEKMQEAVRGIGYDLVTEEYRNVEDIERKAYTVLRRQTVCSFVPLAGTVPKSYSNVSICRCVAGREEAAAPVSSLR